MADVALAGVVHKIRRLVTLPDVKERTDQELLQAFQAQRDQTAFAALVDRHGPLVLRVCRRAHRDAVSVPQPTDGVRPAATDVAVPAHATSSPAHSRDLLLTIHSHTRP